MLHSPDRSRPSAHRIAIGALALSAALMLAACGQSPATPPAAQAAEVGVVTLKVQALDVTRELSGRTVAAETAEIRPQVTGIVKSRLFTEGSAVKAGQALYQIDPASYQATLDSANAAVTKAKATVQSAQLTAKRQASLLAADAGSRQDNETAQTALLQAQAELKSTQASAASARLNVQRTRITAPIGGQVDTSTVTAGALVTANQTTALTTVRRTDPMWVNVTQSSGELLKFRQQIAHRDLRSGALEARLLLAFHRLSRTPRSVNVAHYAQNPLWEQQHRAVSSGAARRLRLARAARLLRAALRPCLPLPPAGCTQGLQGPQ